MPAKRALDLAVCLLLLPVVVPVMVAIALAVLVTSGRPILYRATRMGRGGKVFALLKFRTMRTSMAGSAITRADDPRVTRIGGPLRRTKLDEVPSLFNVLRGEMSLVGPRPEDPRYLPYYSTEEREVLSVPPGITGPTALRFADEERLLSGLPAEQLEHSYSSVYLHEKLRLDLAYIRRRSLVTDLVILGRTALVPMRRRGRGRHQTSRGLRPGAWHWRAHGRHRLDSCVASAPPLLTAETAPVNSGTTDATADGAAAAGLIAGPETAERYAAPPEVTKEAGELGGGAVAESDAIDHGPGEPRTEGEQDADAPDGPLDPAVVRQRASAGIFIVSTRGLAVLVLGLLGNVVFARLLTPRDFGIVAIGTTFVTFLALISDGGLGAGLIRRKEPPRRDELRALTGLQLAITVAAAAIITAIGLEFGEAGRVVAFMAWSMPLVIFQFPGRILLERELRYRPIAWVEVSQVVAYTLGGIGLVVAGAGVWGLAIASVLRAAVGSVAMNLVCPAGRGWPRLAWSGIRPLVAFGIRFQAVTVTWVGKQEGLNLSIAAVAGATVLGLYSLGRRLIGVPQLLLLSLFRVSFPAMSQLLAAKQDPARLIERAVAIAAVGTGVVLAALAGSAPGLIPGVFGEQWRDAAQALPGQCLGMGIGGSIAVGTQGYLYAIDRVGVVLRSQAYAAVAVFAVTLPLLPVLGLWAISIGALGSSMAEAVVLARSTRATVHVRLGHLVAVPAVIGTCAGAAGWFVSGLGGGSIWSGVLGGLVSAAGFLAGLLVFRRRLLLDSASFILSSVRAGLGRR